MDYLGLKKWLLHFWLCLPLGLVALAIIGYLLANEGSDGFVFPDLSGALALLVAGVFAAYLVVTSGLVAVAGNSPARVVAVHASVICLAAAAYVLYL